MNNKYLKGILVVQMLMTGIISFAQTTHVYNWGTNGIVIDGGVSMSILESNNKSMVARIGKGGIIRINNIIMPVHTGDRIEISDENIFINGRPAEIKNPSGEVTQKTFNQPINEVSVPGVIAEVCIGNESRIECDSIVDPNIEFLVHKGKLTAKLNNGVYKTNQPLCKVYAKLLGTMLHANESAHVSLIDQSVDTLHANNYAKIHGSIASTNVAIKADNHASVSLRGAAKNLGMAADNHAKIVFNGEAKKLTMVVNNHGEIAYESNSQVSEGSVDAYADNHGKISFQDNREHPFAVLKAKNRGIIEANNLFATKLDINGSDGARIYAKGEADQQEVLIKDHASYEAKKCKTRLGHIIASNFARASLYVNEKLSGNASNFSEVKYSGGADASEVSCDRFSSCQPW